MGPAKALRPKQFLRGSASNPHSYLTSALPPLLRVLGNLCVDPERELKSMQLYMGGQLRAARSVADGGTELVSIRRHSSPSMHRPNRYVPAWKKAGTEGRAFRSTRESIFPNQTAVKSAPDAGEAS
jgi:hypothetical protein